MSKESEALGGGNREKLGAGPRNALVEL